MHRSTYKSWRLHTYRPVRLRSRRLHAQTDLTRLIRSRRVDTQTCTSQAQTITRTDCMSKQSRLHVCHRDQHIRQVVSIPINDICTSKSSPMIFVHQRLFMRYWYINVFSCDIGTLTFSRALLVHQSLLVRQWYINDIPYYIGTSISFPTILVHYVIKERERAREIKHIRESHR